MSWSRLPYERRGRRLLVWMALFFLLLQLAARRVPGPPPTGRFNDSGERGVPAVEESIVHWQVSHLLTSPETQDVVFFGDSSCLMGLVPDAVTQECGLRGWNFGTLGWLGTDGHADLLELYLERHRAPSVVVYNVSLWPLLATRANVEQAGYLARLREWLARERSGWDTGLMERLPSSRLRRSAQAWLNRLFVRDSQRQGFLTQKRGPYPSDVDMGEALRKRRGFFAEVWVPMPANTPPEPIRKSDPRYGTPLLSADCRPGLERLFRLAEAHGFDLVMQVTPVPDAFQSPHAQECARRMEADLHALAAPHPRVTIRGPVVRWWPCTHFAGLNHLCEASALEYSRDLGRLLRGRLRSPQVSR
jgi:hypothetical protein